jgi:2-oxoglutarate ferredoxin oxidoreductase subunit delta
MKGKIEIDSSLCKGCTFCIIACPKEILSLDEKFNKSGYYPAKVLKADRCTGCALCAEVCPEIAIMVWRENNSSKKKRKRPTASTRRG